METVAIIDYGSGNLRSAGKAFERMIREGGHNARAVVTGDVSVVKDADRIVLPGVGAFGDCRAGLLAVEGMWDLIVDVVEKKGRPFLGICVGMQLMARFGLEHGKFAGFGWIDGDVAPIDVGPDLKIPHMGWNTVQFDQTHPVTKGLGQGDLTHAYFVHSYALKADDPSCVVATAEYGTQITAAVAHDTKIGTQFHPEKSQATGLTLIGNFLSWHP